MTVELCASLRTKLAPNASSKRMHGVVSLSSGGKGGQPIDVICSIDVSGSMRRMIGLVKECLSFMADQLREDDRLSVVTFGQTAQTEFGLSAMDEQGKKKANRCVQKIEAAGQTDLAGGLSAALDQVKNSKPHRASVAVILFFTDGQPTVGVRDPDTIISRTKAALGNSTPEHYKSVTLFTFGFGMDHNTTLLYELANTVKGCYAFIEEEEDIAKHLGCCFAFAANIVACDVTCTVTPVNGNEILQVHTRWPQMSDGSLRLGDINCQGERHVLVELAITPQEVSHAAVARVRYFDVMEKEYKTVSAEVIVERTKDERELLEVNHSVEIHRNRLLAARTLERTTELNDAGKLSEAQKLLKEVITIIEDSVVADDETCIDLVKDLSMCKQGLEHMASQNRVTKLATSAAMSHYTQTGGSYATQGQQELVQQLVSRVGSKGRKSSPAPTTSAGKPAVLSQKVLDARNSEKESLVVPAGHVMKGQIICPNDSQKPFVVVSVVQSKSGKHGYAKTFFQLRSFDGESAEVIMTSSTPVPLFMPAAESSSETKLAGDQTIPCPCCHESPTLKNVLLELPCKHTMCVSCHSDIAMGCFYCP